MHLLPWPRRSCTDRLPPAKSAGELQWHALCTSLRTMDAPASRLPQAMPRAGESWRDLWARTALGGSLLVLAYFALWEIAERTVLAGVDVHLLHLVRGMAGAFLLATWSFLQIRRSRIACDVEMHGLVDRLEDRVRSRTRELADARELIELLFDSLRERIVVFDRDGSIVKANRMALEHGAHPEGRVWEVESIAVPDDRGGTRFTIEVGRDVTEQRNLEAQVRHQEKMASLGVLAAGFAHDLGNPLASLSAELEMLEGEDDVARFEESLGVLRRHVARMSRTLREMVDFARRRRDEVTDVSIALAVADSARLVCHDPRWKKVRLEVDVPPDLPYVHMVEDHLVLVLVNLMLNAADAMTKGGTLSVKGRRHGDGVELRLRDTGAGMSPEVLSKALTPLFTTKTAGRGTGLGLAVSSGVVRSVGGTLRIESTEGVGTEVIIELPGGGTSDG